MPKSNQPADLDSICLSIFIPLRISPDGSYISREKIQEGLQEMEFQRHVASQGPVRYLRSFLICYFSKRYCTRFQTRPRFCCQQHSINFAVEFSKKLFSLRTDENDFVFPWPRFCLQIFFPKHSNPSLSLFIAYKNILINL